MTRAAVEDYVGQDVLVITSDGKKLKGFAGAISCEFDTSSGEEELEIIDGEVEYGIELSAIESIRLQAPQS